MSALCSLRSCAKRLRWRRRKVSLISRAPSSTSCCSNTSTSCKRSTRRTLPPEGRAASGRARVCALGLRIARLESRLFKLQYLPDLGAEDAPDLIAFAGCLVGIGDRAFELLRDGVPFGKCTIQARKVFERGDQEQIRIIGTRRIELDYFVRDDVTQLLRRFLLFLVGRVEVLHVIVEMAVERSNLRDDLDGSFRVGVILSKGAGACEGKAGERNARSKSMLGHRTPEIKDSFSVR